MDRRELDELVATLEAAITQQHVQTGDSHQDVLQHVTRCKEALESLLNAVTEVGGQGADARAETTDRLAALKDSLSAFDPETVAKLERSLAESTRAAQDAERRAGELEKKLRSLTEAEGAARERIQVIERRLAEESAALQPAKNRVAALEQELTQRDDALKAAQRQVAEMEAHLGTAAPPGAKEGAAETRAAAARVAELQDILGAANAELENLRSRAREVAASERTKSEALEAAELDNASLRSELESRPIPSEDASALENQLKAERQRADKAEQELKKTRKSALAQELAEALEEGEKASAEIEEMRGELDEFRRAAAKKAKAERAQKDEVSQAREKRIRKAASGDRETQRRRMGDILVDAGVITAEHLQRALELQKTLPNTRLGAVLVQEGFTDEDTVAQVLASQLDIEFLHIDEDDISADAARLINGRLAELHCCIPVRASGDRLTLAMTNPLDLIAIEDVERATEHIVEPVVATTSDITSSISQFYGL